MQGFDLHWCKQSDVGLPKPDLVFFLEVKPEEAEKRDDFGDERYESTAFQVKVKNNFDLLREESWRVSFLCKLKAVTLGKNAQIHEKDLCTKSLTSLQFGVDKNKWC